MDLCGLEKGGMRVTSSTTSTKVCERRKYLLKSRFNNSRLNLACRNMFSPMPGLLNSLRSPSSPNLFQKFRSVRNSPPPERPQLTRRETVSLIECIASIHTQIFELERHVKNLYDNTLTVCRNIQHIQPDFTPPITIRLPDIFQETVILSSAETLPKKPPRKWSSIHLLRSPSSSSDDKLDIPAALSECATDVPEAERELRINFEDIVLMADSEPGLQGELDLLALKKAQLEVEVMKLEVNLLFWGGLYKQVRSVYWQEEKEEARRKSHCYTWRPSTPSLLGQWSFDADSIPSEYTEGSGSDTLRKLPVPRKRSIREIIARIKAAAVFLFRPGTKRDYSWSEYNDLFLPESSDIRARETSSSTEGEISDDPEQGYTRGGSDFDISADIECAIEELRGIPQL